MSRVTERPTPEEQRELADAHLGRLLLQALRRVQANSLGKLQAGGHPDVRTGHLPVFSNVDEGGTRITDLAGRAGMTRQMMGRLVRELEDLGYAQTRPDPHDQRAVVVSLTERGWQFCHDGQVVIAEQEREYAGMLGAETLRQLKSALLRLAAEGGAPTDSPGA